MSANDTQVGGNHYQQPVQHWDVMAMLRANYFQGQVTKYLYRWRKKNGLEDLHKAMHFLEKYVEIIAKDEWMQLNPVHRTPYPFYNVGLQKLLSFTSTFKQEEKQVTLDVMLWKDLNQLKFAQTTLKEYIDAVEQEEGYPTSKYTNQG